MRTLHVMQPGQMDYEPAVQLQRDLVERLRQAPDAEDGYLILLEHPPVVTVGRTGSDDHILLEVEELRARGIEVHETNRGGDVTYHGPGQLVAYPIIRLYQHGKDLHGYLRRLEGVIIATLGTYGIEASPDPPVEFRKADGAEAPMTGAWVGDRKIASIGIAVTHWIAYHGAALNVSTNLRDYEIIHPCGMPEVRMTSMAELLDEVPTVTEVGLRFAQAFAQAFGFETHSMNRK
ncbi:MAG: lipoyl(octanoyl) transferase LipB [Planctomycetota bacterium]